MLQLKIEQINFIKVTIFKNIKKRMWQWNQ